GRSGQLSDRLPAASVGVGLLLLAPVPSKWIWHFGEFMGLCTVAMTIEARRIAAAMTRAWRARVQSVSILVGVLGTTVWAMSNPEPWGPIDVRATSWRQIPYVEASLLVPALGLVVMAVISASRRTRDPLRVYRAVALWCVPLAVAPALLLTTAA